MRTTYQGDIETVAVYYGLHRQLIKLIEELGEAASAASEAMNMSMFYESNGKEKTMDEMWRHLIAELADVRVMTDQILYLLLPFLDTDKVFDKAREKGLEKTLARISQERLWMQAGEGKNS